MIVFLNGKFLRDEDAKVSVFDHGFLYGDGVYETLRTYGGRIWQIDEHLRRLEKSCKLVGVGLPWDRKKIGGWVEKTVQKNGFGKWHGQKSAMRSSNAGRDLGLQEARIRITVTRGENGFDFVSSKKPTILIQVQKLISPPAEVFKKGVSVVTFKAQRFLPEAKSISLLAMVMGTRFAQQKKAYEAVFVDDADYVLEGTITNIFVVKKDRFGENVLLTPKSNVLAGTTRDLLLKIAKKNGLKALLADFKLKDLYAADEVFITNAPRGIIPVVKIDGKKIGNGRPGAVTLNLLTFHHNGCK